MLTVVQIKALKPAERPFKVADSEGLYILVQPSGALLWRFRYRSAGSSENFRSGAFLKSHWRKLAESETRPGQSWKMVSILSRKSVSRLKAELAAQTTFGLVAEEYIQKMEREGRAPATIKKAR